MTDTHADFTIDHKFGEDHRIDIKEPDRVSRPLMIEVYNTKGVMTNPSMSVYYDHIMIYLGKAIPGKYRVIIHGWRPQLS